MSKPEAGYTPINGGDDDDDGAFSPGGNFAGAGIAASQSGIFGTMSFVKHTASDAANLEQRSCVIVPEKGSKASVLVRVWDDLLIVVLVGEAFWAPVVIAFPYLYNLQYGLFSRFQDVLLTTDMIANFFVAIPRDVDCGSRNLWEKRLSRIAYNYLVPSLKAASGLFWLDLLAVAPGWKEVLIDKKLINTHMRGGHSVVGFLLRWTRFIRLLKSMRGLHFAKSIEHYRIQLGMPHWLTDALLLAVVLILSCHIAACVFIMFEGKVSPSWFSFTEDFETSWLEAVLARGDPCFHEAGTNPLCIYTLAFYWAASTLTTVGYGDITPQNQVEYIVSSLIMVMFGFLWAFIVGATVTLMSTMDPIGTAFKQESDDINRLMSRMDISRSLKVQMRRYLIERRHVNYDHQERKLLRSSFPLSLQTRVAAESPVRQFLLDKVFWAKDLASDTLLRLVMSLQPRFYPPEELIRIRGMMFVVWSGLVASKGKVMIRGDAYGHSDILLSSPGLMEDSNPRTLTYVDLLVLEKDALRWICEDDPNADRRLRRAQVRTAVMRGFVRAGKCQKSKLAALIDKASSWTGAADGANVLAHSPQHLPYRPPIAEEGSTEGVILQELKRMEQRLNERIETDLGAMSRALGGSQSLTNNSELRNSSG